MRATKFHQATLGRQIWTGAAALALILGAAACSSGSSSATSANNSATTGKLVVWDFQVKSNPQYAAVIKAADKQFEKDHPGVTVDLVAQSSDPTTYTQVLQSAFLAKSGFDVAMMQPGGDGVLTYTSELVPLDSLISPTLKNQLIGWSDTSANGKAYGVPFGAQGILGFYNKALFTKAGLDPNTPPTTYSQLLTDAAKLKAAGIVPFAGGVSGAGDYSVEAFSNLFPGLGTKQQSIELADNKLKFTSPLVESVVQKYVNIYKDGYFGPGFLSEDFDTSVADFEANKGAITFSYGAAMTYLADNNGAGGGGVGPANIGLIPPVGITKATPLYNPVGATLDWSVPKFSTKQKLAAEWISYITGATVAQQFYNKAGVLPNNNKVNPAMGASAKHYPALAPMVQGFLSAKNGELGAHQLWLNPVATAFKKQMQAVLDGSESINAGMQAVQQVQDQQKQ